MKKKGAKITTAERSRARGLLLIRIGTARRDRGMTDEGIHLLKQALPAMVDDEEIQYQLGVALASLGNTRDAEAYWRHLLEMSPRHEAAVLQMANAMHDSGQYVEADQLYSRFNALNPWQAVTHGRWAHTLGQLNRLDDAISQAHRAIQLDPSMWPIYFWIADAYAIKGESEKSQHYKRLGERLAKAAKPQ